MPVRIALGRPRRPPAKLHRTTRSSLPVVICANNVSSSFGARAIPISPPSPKPEGVTTPATSPTELTLPLFEIRTTRPEFRSETSASPELRKAIPQGTSRLSAMMPVTFGLGVAVRDGEADGVRAEPTEVGAGLGVPFDGSSSGEELDALWPSAVPEHPATTPRAAPAEPRSSVRRETTLNCGALPKEDHRNEPQGRSRCAPGGADVRCAPHPEPEASVPVLRHRVASCTGDGPADLSSAHHIGVQCGERFRRWDTVAPQRWSGR